VPVPYEKQTHCKNGHEFTDDSVYVSHRASGQVMRQCRICVNEQNRAAYEPLTIAERAERRNSFPSRAKGKHYQRKYKYGLGEEQVRELLEYQGGGCGICDRPLDLDATDKKSKVAVDHNHETGEVRGILCQNCNTGIGMFDEDPRTIRRALAYVQMGQVGKIA